MLMWEEAAIKDDVIEYDIAFNIIYIMRTHIAVAKLRCPSHLASQKVLQKSGLRYVKEINIFLQRVVQVNNKR